MVAILLRPQFINANYPSRFERSLPNLIRFRCYTLKQNKFGGGINRVVQEKSNLPEFNAMYLETWYIVNKGDIINIIRSWLLPGKYYL